MEQLQRELYKVMFKEYPDVLDVKQVSAALDVSTKIVYRLLRDGTIASLKMRVPRSQNSCYEVFECFWMCGVWIAAIYLAVNGESADLT